MKKASLKKFLVAMVLVTAGTTANADEKVNGREELNNLLFSLAQTMMVKQAAPDEQVSTVKAKTGAASATVAKKVTTTSARIIIDAKYLVASNN